MKAAYRWIRELAKVEISPATMAETLTAHGIEVEEQHVVGGLPGVVIAEVREKASHPTKRGLTLVKVLDGEHIVDVVCGAPNVPDVGGRVALARVGSVLPNGMTIAERSVAGSVSRGMLCSESELGIGAESDGIMVLDDASAKSAKLGASLASVLQLDDVIFGLSLTPNRPDALGHIGLAREIAAAMNVPFALPVSAPLAPDAGVDISIVSPERCEAYAAVLVKGVRVGPSPWWLRYRLHTLGLRSLSNVVDATNLVLLEWGYPTHAFDLARVEGHRIEVRVAKDGEPIALLDGSLKTLTAEDLVIADKVRPMALAGVMGGRESAVSETTTDVVLEAAYFKPNGIRRTSKRHGLHTDASHRFERGVDRGAVEQVVARVAEVVTAVAGGSASLAAHVSAVPIRAHSISLRMSRVSGLLGIEVTQADAKAKLAALGCSVTEASTDVLSVVVPGHRPDLVRDVDLIEEVARLTGYDAIPAILPHVLPSEGAHDPALAYRAFAEDLRRKVAGEGLLEARTLAFESRESLAPWGLADSAVPLENPLSEERALMRPSLLPSLLHAASRATNRQVSTVAIFELAATFSSIAWTAALPDEKEELSLVLAGERRRGSWLGNPEHYDFYDARGILENALRGAVAGVEFVSLDEYFHVAHPYLHPRRAAVCRAGESVLGVLGELHPDLAAKYDIVRPIVARLSVRSCFDARSTIARRTDEPSRFPRVARDFAFIVAEETRAHEMELVARSTSPLVKDVSVFDVYRGTGIPQGKKSIALRVVYEDRAATLTDARVEAAHQALKANFASKLGAILREG